MASEEAVRQHVGRLLAWEDAHVGFDTAIEGIPAAARGKMPDGLPYTPWQLLEHLRRTQRDILEFCRNSDYRGAELAGRLLAGERRTANAAERGTRASRNSGRTGRLFSNSRPTRQWISTATIPHGSGQTYLRELLLVADHSAYHIGELIVVRRLLGVWK